MFKIDKPLPAITEDAEPYWEGARRHQLRMQCCKGCAHIWFPPSAACPRCLSADFAWERVSGRGRVFSWIIVHRPQHPAFFADAPYNVAIVELEEGPRLHTNIVGCANEAIRMDMPVEVVFEKVDDEVTLPKFRPREG